MRDLPYVESTDCVIDSFAVGRTDSGGDRATNMSLRAARNFVLLVGFTEPDV